MNLPSIRYRPANRCIYCSSLNPPLSDEHIIPYALNGALVIPAASCSSCADCTKRFEQCVARTIYGSFRLKHGYRTRRPKERPKTIALFTGSLDGARVRIDVPVNDYPDVYLAVDSPPPGILCGCEPSDRNPEMKFSLKGDPEALDRVMKMYALQSVGLNHLFDWGAFFRQLAKIGHCYAYACTNGLDYEQLLPPLILGKSSFLSHYIGGVDDSSSSDLTSSDLSLSIVSRPSGDYLVVGVNLLGIGTLHPYQVVAGRIHDLEQFITTMVQLRGAA